MSIVVRRVFEGDTSLQEIMESILSSFFIVEGGGDSFISMKEEVIPVTLLKSTSNLKEGVS